MVVILNYSYLLTRDQKDIISVILRDRLFGNTLGNINIHMLVMERQTVYHT